MVKAVRRGLSGSSRGNMVSGDNEPVSRYFGLDRGTPIDRYYIERFLDANRGLIRGRVLEIGDAHYTKKYGGKAVEISDVLHAEAGCDGANIVGSLEKDCPLESGVYDCIILTQTLNVIFDLGSVVKNVYASLRSGGVLLATVPGISQISRYDMDRWGDYWRFTDRSARRLLCEEFDEESVVVETYGNVSTACSFLYGLAAEDLKTSDLSIRDENYQLLVAITARKG